MKKILIVEDDRRLNDGIRLALRNEFSCSQAFSLEEAGKMLGNGSFDLILLDVNLPDGSGLDLLAELRRTEETPVILLTANRMEMDIVSGLELGADDYITKPFSLMVLRARVGVQLRKKRREDEITGMGRTALIFRSWNFTGTAWSWNLAGQNRSCCGALRKTGGRISAAAG